MDNLLDQVKYDEVILLFLEVSKKGFVTVAECNSRDFELFLNFLTQLYDFVDVCFIFELLFVCLGLPV